MNFRTHTDAETLTQVHPAIRRTFTSSFICNIMQHQAIFLRGVFQVCRRAMKTTQLSLAIKPCYLQLAATGDEIQAAGRTCGDKISSRSAVGHQAAAYTRNVLCCTQSLRACLLFLIRSCHRDVHSSGLCHPVILALTHHSSNCHPLMTFNETT